MKNDPSDLRSIVYVSDAVGRVSPAQLEALWVEGRTRCVSGGATGALLFSGTTFMHCLEGSDSSVRRAFERVRAKPEHSNVVELLNEPVERFSFSEWHMGVASPSASELLNTSTARWEHHYLWTQGWKVPRPLELLRLFWSRNAFGTGDACILASLADTA